MDTPPTRAPWFAAAGLLAVAVALGVSELLAGAFSATSPVLAVGQVIIDSSPGEASRFAIRTFGQNDKPALIVMIIVVSLALGAGAGLLARRSLLPGAALLAVLGVAGVIAGNDDPATNTATAVVIAVLSAACGMGVLALLASAATSASGPGSDAPHGFAASRRRFLQLGGGALGIAFFSLVTGRWVFGPPVDIEAEREAIRLPSPQPPAVPPPDPATAALNVDGVSPLVTPNADFYRIDTALTVPGVEVDGWRLRITGLVDQPYELSYEELLEMGVHEATVTLACVSNQVGGDLVGNATWLGVSLAAILDRAGVQAAGTQVVARSVDGFTTAFPTAMALDGRPSMVAVGMNGEVLPAPHGFPARMIVPGLYGYVSATKWLEEIELVTGDFDAYWITRGWSKEGPIKTQSRFDIPEGGGTIAAGAVQLGGVAWAGNRRVETVEVRVIDVTEAEGALGNAWRRDMGPDYGEWQPAELSGELSESAWRQWALEWDATPGEYRVEVRATDGSGEPQTHEKQEPAPDGATGFDGFEITVT